MGCDTEQPIAPQQERQRRLWAQLLLQCRSAASVVSEGWAVLLQRLHGCAQLSSRAHETADGGHTRSRDAEEAQAEGDDEAMISR